MNVTKLETATTPQRTDDKYVVFKRSQVDELMLALFGGEDPPTWAYDELDGYAVEDAVVIRTQDEFAGPALHSYANIIVAVASHINDDIKTRQLLSVADYFADRAREADDAMLSGTAKLPGVHK